MKIYLANPRGFCAGVNMAIETLETSLELFGTPLYVYHEIVHNRPVVELFSKRGVKFVNSISEIPEGSTVLYSAHGVAPLIREESTLRKLRAIDATCPLVTKVHNEAIRYAKEGYVIILIGHEGHDEVLGTMGEAPHAIHLVEDIEDVENLPYPNDVKIAYLTQTTLSVDETIGIIAALKKKYPTIAGPAKADICYATQNRQEAVKQLSPNAQIVLVLGSQNSSNSQRLAEIARQEGKKAYLLDTVKELKKEWFSPNDTVLITAGASAPEQNVQEVVDYLRTEFDATVESFVVREEHVSFPLPRELRGLTVIGKV
ncbi:4-hydroxy-3-methylbut-2-enyl diphosphate reductase [Telmatocola sphagniphila]|uniref:4-hydroxy-3-methylbut-2-enyl diphosphate reductase n=1 Tax=Telmatocola sphagniphila TaxID=1123043 RepID=A0A8E6BCI5_9BACT|nr:4-hydroxy-3-methylbut-2-enyl diphosphate reductase [Telmatocola sphagniphila]QVL34668.1 4-hydroxy-3-methylbut-2-enyl diphosphate reductase [Telmatocola sphagniphila]